MNGDTGAVPCKSGKRTAVSTANAIRFGFAWNAAAIMTARVLTSASCAGSVMGGKSRSEATSRSPRAC